MSARAIILFLKYPEPGAAKTRLTRDLGADYALAIYRKLVAHTIRSLPRDADPILCFHPPHCEEAIAKWTKPPQNAQLLAQSDGTLGDRLLAASRFAIQKKYRQIAIVGTDCPDIAPHHFDQSWHLLEKHDLVLGPAQDGGYYLIAFRALHPELFADITWGSTQVLSQTLAAAQRGQLRVAQLETLSDIDTGDDWESWQRREKN